MAQIITTGPAHMFIGRSAENTDVTGLEYLGTFEKSPVIDIQTLTQPVMNDIGGESAISHAMQGQIATIQGVMNRYDEVEYAKIESGYYNATRRGEIEKNKLGGLAQAMSLDFDVLFYFPFHSSFRTDAANSDAPEGLHFVSVVPVKFKLAELSTRARTIEIALRSIPKMSIQTDTLTNVDSNGAAGPASIREFVLYKHLTTVPNALKEKVN
jgi:hypothetical protein